MPAPPGDVIEIDEVCVRFSPGLWLWIAVSRLTGQVLGFALGDRGDETLARCWAQVPPDYRGRPVRSDHWGAYARLLPAEQHRACDKGSGETSHAEAWNTKWRQRQSGLVRRSCGVSVRGVGADQSGRAGAVPAAGRPAQRRAGQAMGGPPEAGRCNNAIKPNAPEVGGMLLADDVQRGLAFSQSMVHLDNFPVYYLPHLKPNRLIVHRPGVGARADEDGLWLAQAPDWDGEADWPSAAQAWFAASSRIRKK